MRRLRQLWTLGTVAAVLATVAPPTAHAARASTSDGLVVCAKRKNDKLVKVRVGACRSDETPVPVDAQTLQGLTVEQVINARPASSSSGSASGLALVDAVGQVVGYLVFTPSGTRVVRPVGPGLVALNVQHVGGAAPDLAWRMERGFKYFHQSADCSSPALLPNSPGFDDVIREGHILVGQASKVVYPGDSSVTAIQAYSTPPNDETGNCSHDVGDPPSVPTADGRCCVSLAPYSELKVVGPLVTEDLPAFVQPLHVLGF